MSMAKSNDLGGAPKKKSRAAATQRYLEIEEIREDTVVLRDGTLRAVIAVSSVNFALKSEEEQDAVISQYVQFLNAIDFPIQVVIHSRPLDVDPYIDKLQKLEREQKNELLKLQMADYRKFVSELVTLGQIMTKSFYVVVPYSPITDARKTFVSRLGAALSPAKLVRLQDEKFQERRTALLERVGHVTGSLQSLGLKTVMLETQALIQLYYSLYNPVTMQFQKLPETSELQVET